MRVFNLVPALAGLAVAFAQPELNNRKAATCVAQPTGPGPIAKPDTAAAFEKSAALAVRHCLNCDIGSCG
jgi:hypothetical protein